MLLGSDVSASLLENVEGVDGNRDYYYAKVDGCEDQHAIAYKPGDGTKFIRGRVIALFMLKDGENIVKSRLIAPYGVEKYLPDIIACFPGAYNIVCLYEKSCGAVVFFGRGDKRLYLLIENRAHNWGFPKGHIEPGEDERATAAREVFEETGLKPQFIAGYRETVSYYIKDSVRKTAVYFVAETCSDSIRIPSGEISSYKLMTMRDALSQLTYKSERSLLIKAESFLQKAGM